MDTPVFVNPPAAAIAECLRRVRTIAVVGLSAHPGRPSHDVAAALQRMGYRILPVNPALSAALGETAYADLAALPLVPDLVEVFRAPEHVAAIVDDCIRLRLPALWLQDGVIDAVAAARARAAGIFTVMDRCVWRDRVRLD